MKTRSDRAANPVGLDNPGHFDNRKLADLFSRIAQLLEFKNEDQFKIRAYQNAAESIEDYPEQLSEIAGRGGVAALEGIPGIGKSISAKIIEILQTGELDFYRELITEVPETLPDLLRVPGIGMKTAQVLFRDFGVSNLKDLRAFAESGGLRLIHGLGERGAEKVMASLQASNIDLTPPSDS